MVDNIDADNGRARESGDGVLPGAVAAQGESAGQSAGEAQGAAHPPSAGVNEEGAPEGVPELNVEEQLRGPLFGRFRALFHDLPDRKFDEIVAALRVPESISSIARGLIEQGYCAHLHPTTVRMHLTRFRDAMGWPRYSAQPEEPEPPTKIDKLDETGELIEALPPMKRLSWLIRVQHARVRKALKFEGQMPGMTLSTTAAEIKLLSDLLDKELIVAMKTGDLKSVPQEVKLQPGDAPVTDPAAAYRVILAYRRLMRMAQSEEIPGGVPATDVPAGTDGAGATSDNSGARGDPGGAVGGAVPENPAVSPVGPAPGAGGDDGRT